MKIRSITYFCDPKYPLEQKVLRTAGLFLSEARSAYEAAGYEVQTVRLATIPFPHLIGEEQLDRLPELVAQFEEIAKGLSIGYVSLGPALPEIPRSYEIIPEAIFVSPNVFFGAVMADASRGLHLPSVRACADAIVRCAAIEPNGFANLQFAALANVDAGAPFFPAAYHDAAGSEPVFALATESADLAVHAFEDAKTVEEGRSTLVSEIESHGRRLTEVAEALHCRFGGLDFSLAPFPEQAQSLGTAFEKLGVPRIGMHGSLAAAALLTESIDRADFPRAGFCGLMMPVLEDSTLAERAADGTLTVKDLLLYSAVCGTGLDTIPLPGETTSDQLVPLLLDLCALALRLDKPLTARLMPIPGKRAGEPTNFDFDFFAPSRVMGLGSAAVTPPLNGDEILQIRKRRSHPDP